MLDEQGTAVEFPPKTRGVQPRTAFGQSGIGRHGAFCFSDRYTFVTERDGHLTEVDVRMTPGGVEPFNCELLRHVQTSGHGTSICTTVTRNFIDAAAVIEVIGLKFLVVPNFSVSVNNRLLSLLDFDKVASATIDVPDVGQVTVRQIDSAIHHRTTQLHRITWWVGRKMVGEAGCWDGLDGYGHMLDGRSAAAKRFSFIIETDPLKQHVKGDWSGFGASPRVQSVQKAVHEHVIKQVDGVLADNRRKQSKRPLSRTGKS